jgi:hypothetical protein
MFKRIWGWFDTFYKARSIRSIILDIVLWFSGIYFAIFSTSLSKYISNSISEIF